MSLPREVGDALTAFLKRCKIDMDQAKNALESCHRNPIRLAEIDLVMDEILEAIRKGRERDPGSSAA